MNEETKQTLLWPNFLKSTIDIIKKRKEQIKTSNADTEQTWRINDSVNLYAAQFNTTDKELQKKYDVASRWAELAWMIVDYGKDNKIEITWTNADIINTYLRWNPWASEAFYNFTHSDQDAEDFAKQMWWYSGKISNNDAMSVWDVATIEWWALGFWALQYPLWKLNEKLWESLYSSAFAPDYVETKKWTQAWWDVIVAEERLKKAEKTYNEAKKSWEWIEEASKALEDAKKALEEAKNIKVSKKWNVWLERWLAWTRQQIANQAYAQEKLLFEDTILPALKNSNSSIDVQALIDEIGWEIETLAKKDPVKLQAYTKALEEMKQDYSFIDFADFPLESAQELKSWLQWRTPQKFYNRWWLQAEITDEYKELQWILGSKLRKSLISELEKWGLKDAEKLYSDWAKLNNIVEDANKALSKGTMNKELWNPKNILFKNKDLWSFVRTKWGKSLDKVWKFQQKVFDLVKGAKETKAGKWISKALNIWKRWLTILDKLLTPLMYYDAASYALRSTEDRNQEVLDFIKKASSNWEMFNDDLINWMLEIYNSSDWLITVTEADIRRAIAEWEADRQGMDLLPEWLMK